MHADLVRAVGQRYALQQRVAGKLLKGFERSERALAVFRIDAHLARYGRVRRQFCLYLEQAFRSFTLR